MNRVIHFEIGADEPERAAEFYRKTFGWEIKKWEGPEPYWLAMTGPKSEMGIDGGIFKKPNPTGANIINTIGVESVDDFVKIITENGGKILMPKSAIPGVGYFAYCADTEGNPFGIMQADMSAKMV